MKVDLLNQRFTRLLVIAAAPPLKPKNANATSRPARWVCKCDCGNEVVVASRQLRRLDGTQTKSCGCLQKEVRAASKAEAAARKAAKKAKKTVADGS